VGLAVPLLLDSLASAFRPDEKLGIAVVHRNPARIPSPSGDGGIAVSVL
jgi:hypothetical protein